jgi:uncharacterized protein with LGFP repeats
MGESGSPLGLPTSDTRDNASGTGRHNLFQHGSIHASHRTGPCAVWGRVFTTWSAAGMAMSPLGLPLTDTKETADGDGQYADFEHGSIYATPSSGTRTVVEPVLVLWSVYQRERGPLGYPTGDVDDLPQGMGQTQPFDHGVIDMTPDGGVHAVWGPIFDSWVAQYGRETGTLGAPVTDVYAVDPQHDRCDFAHGSLVVDKTTGAVTQP